MGDIMFLTIHDLHKSYGEKENKLEVLKGINLNVKKGEICVLLGPSGSGKSTLLNRIVGQKIAIMSDKAQTTRNKIQGVYTTPEAQLIFIDTPGIHKPKHRLGDFMVESAYSALCCLIYDQCGSKTWTWG